MHMVKSIFSLLIVGLAVIAFIVLTLSSALPFMVVWGIFLISACVSLALAPRARLLLFVLLVVGSFNFISEVITRISGTSSASVVAAGVNPEAGEAIFWGKGKCHTCHSVGGRGSAIRCPNLGPRPDKSEDTIAVRAVDRATERIAKEGNWQMDGLAFASWTDYLVESIADPGAYVVEGYKNEMPYVYKPPISLTPDEIKAVIAYLQIQGGDFDIDGIKLPDRLLKASTSPEAPFVSYIPILKRSLLYYEDEELEPQSRFDSIVSGLQGDPEMGAEIFFEGTENSIACGKCHIAKDLEGEIRGATVGPELTTVAGTQPPQYIVESILSPSAKIASGYEQELIQTTGGVRHIGIIKMEDDTQVVLQMQEGEDVKEVPIPKGEIARRATSKLSLMPEGFAESFTVQQFHDLLAYVLTLRGEEETSVAETSDQNTRNIDEGE